TLDSRNKQVKVDSIYSVLHHIEKTISSPDWMKGESNSVMNQLMEDLLMVLNQTLGKTLGNKFLGEQDTLLIREIAENLWELLFPDLNNQAKTFKGSQYEPGNLP